ncbi:hypothetical protein CC2G_014541 [Coprinopsis cinerea AmutBmut pab1-1]|nr:hypothetical protein CC2G_014541 [Coprinopsis cinerea AmutBmut pab1-1]
MVSVCFPPSLRRIPAPFLDLSSLPNFSLRPFKLCLLQYGVHERQSPLTIIAARETGSGRTRVLLFRIAKTKAAICGHLPHLADAFSLFPRILSLGFLYLTCIVSANAMFMR